MGCSWFGVGALVVLLATAVLNVVALILPMWSTSNSINASLITKLTRAEFAAGLWGFCTDVELSWSASNDSQTLNHCYFFHTPTSYNLTAIAPTLASNFAELSVCDGYQESRAIGVDARRAYASMLASVAGINSTSFTKFLDVSCGSLGNATLSFGSIGMAAAVLALIALILGITCTKKTSVIILIGRLFVVLAFLSTMLTWILWLVQSRMLNDEDDVAVGGSFELAVSACVLYLVSMGIVAAHKDKIDDLDIVWAGPLYILANWK